LKKTVKGVKIFFRFWLIDCRQPSESSSLAHAIYAEATRVPYMAKFLVFAKAQDPLEAILRVYCLTDDRWVGVNCWGQHRIGLGKKVECSAFFESGTELT